MRLERIQRGSRQVTPVRVQYNTVASISTAEFHGNTHKHRSDNHCLVGAWLKNEKTNAFLHNFYSTTRSKPTKLKGETVLNYKGLLLYLDILNIPATSKEKWKKRSERRKHYALAVVRRSQKFPTLFQGVRDGQNLISWRRSLPLPTNPVRWGLMHAISSYRGNKPTHTHTQPPPPHTHPQTWPITIHYAAVLLQQFTATVESMPERVATGLILYRSQIIFTW